jgi:glucose/mannose transport system substrate-binding protein
MQKRRIIGAFAASLLVTTTAFAEDLVVYHSWSSASEVAALNVLREGLTEKGHTWTDIAIPHDTGSNVNLMALITGGQPPNVFMESSPGVYRDLAGLGFEFDLTSWYEQNGYLDHIPAAAAGAIRVDDKIVKVPTGLHIDGMVYYNKAVAEEVGVDPAAWASLDDMFADFEKVRAAGKTPLAVGSQPFQVGYLLHALTAAIGGAELYNRVYGPEPDVTAFDTPEYREVLDTLRKFSLEAGADAQNRPWNETTNQVITGNALMQLHGDWMKGEWLASGATPGQEFGCLQVPGAKAVVVTVDAWGLLGGVDEAKQAAELDFASVVLDPARQAAFAAAKGSTPVRLDVPEGSVDVCSQNVLEVLADPARQVQSPNNTVDADWQNSIWDVAFTFWGDHNESAEDAIAQMKENYDFILN